MKRRFRHLPWASIVGILFAGVACGSSAGSTGGDSPQPSDHGNSAGTHSDAGEGGSLDSGSPHSSDGGGSSDFDSGGSFGLVPRVATVGGAQWGDCALGTGGVYCWPQSFVGADIGSPTLVAGTSGAKNFIAFESPAGSSDGDPLVVVCPIDASGAVTCGSKLGSPTGAHFVRFAPGNSAACGIDATGEAWCWGTNFIAVTQNIAPVSAPYHVVLPKRAIDIVALGGATMEVLLEDGSLYEFVGFEGPPAKNLVDLGGRKAVKLSTNFGYNCVAFAILSDGSLFDLAHDVHTVNDHFTGAADVAVNYYDEFCTLRSDGTLRCLDQNEHIVDPEMPETIVELQAGSRMFYVRGKSGKGYMFDVGGPAPTELVTP